MVCRRLILVGCACLSLAATQVDEATMRGNRLMMDGNRRMQKGARVVLKGAALLDEGEREAGMKKVLEGAEKMSAGDGVLREAERWMIGAGGLMDSGQLMMQGRKTAMEGLSQLLDAARRNDEAALGGGRRKLTLGLQTMARAERMMNDRMKMAP